MVKGVSKRVIVIKSPDPRLFEEAIFIVKEDALHGGVTQNMILREAQDVASRYVRAHKRKGIFRRFPSLLSLISGAAAATLVWLAIQFLF